MRDERKRSNVSEAVRAVVGVIVVGSLLSFVGMWALDYDWPNLWASINAFIDARGHVLLGTVVGLGILYSGGRMAWDFENRELGAMACLVSVGLAWLLIFLGVIADKL